MKFDNKIKKILLEYFHISFLGDKMYTMDFRIEKYKGNYNEFLNNARNLAVKLQSDRDKEKFKSEIMSQKERIALALVSSFQKEFNNPSKNKEEKINFVINKFLLDLSV